MYFLIYTYPLRDQNRVVTITVVPHAQFENMWVLKNQWQFWKICGHTKVLAWFFSIKIFFSVLAFCNLWWTKKHTLDNKVIVKYEIVICISEPALRPLCIQRSSLHSTRGWLIGLFQGGSSKQGEGKGRDSYLSNNKGGYWITTGFPQKNGKIWLMSWKVYLYPIMNLPIFMRPFHSKSLINELF